MYTSASSSWKRQLACLLPAFLLAAWVLHVSQNPIQWGDGGFFVVQASQGVPFPHDLGPLSHPLFHVLSVMLFQAFGPIGLTTFNSVLFFALVPLVFTLARQLGCTAWQASVAVLAALSTHAVLWVATRVEVYVLHLLLVLIAWCIYLAGRDRPRGNVQLALLGALTGLAGATHQLTFVVLAPMFFSLLLAERTRMLSYALGFVLGMAPCYPGLWAQLQDGKSLVDALRGYLTGYDPAGVKADWTGALWRLDKLFAKPMPLALALLSLMGVGLWGLIFGFRERADRLIWMAAVVNVAFALTYNVPDRNTFLLPGAVLLAVLGTKVLSQRAAASATSRSGLFGPPVVAAVAPVLVCHLLAAVNLAGLVTLPDRPAVPPFMNELSYVLAPLIPDDSAAHFVAAYMQVVPQGAMVYADWLPEMAMRSAQATGEFTGRTVHPCKGVKVAAPSSEPRYLAHSFGCEDLMALRPVIARIGLLIPGRGAANPTRVAGNVAAD
jgi:hypothetical protein